VAWDVTPDRGVRTRVGDLEYAPMH